MNKGKRVLNNRVNKKMHKDIKSAQQAYQLSETRLSSDELTPQAMLKNYPKRVTTKTLNAVTANKKRMEVKLARHKKTSKRTTPGTFDVDTESPRMYGHAEGARWMKTVVTQSVGRRKALSKHMAKQRLTKRK